MSKPWTDNQKERLADPGYYVIWFDNPLVDREKNLAEIIHIGLESCSYIHHLWGKNWCTLSWVAAPTKKKISEGYAKEGIQFQYCPSHSSLVDFLQNQGIFHQFPFVSNKAPSE